MMMKLLLLRLLRVLTMVLMMLRIKRAKLCLGDSERGQWRLEIAKGRLWLILEHLLVGKLVELGWLTLLWVVLYNCMVVVWDNMVASGQHMVVSHTTPSLYNNVCVHI